MRRRSIVGARNLLDSVLLKHDAWGCGRLADHAAEVENGLTAYPSDPGLRPSGTR